MRNPSIQTKIIRHRGVDRLAVCFDYDFSIIKKIKTISGRRYSSTLKCWHLPISNASVSALESFGIPVSINMDQVLNNTEIPNQQKKSVPEGRVSTKKEIETEWKEKLVLYKEYLIQQRYSQRSISTYLQVMTQFFVWLTEVGSSVIDIEILRKFNYQFFLQNKQSRSYQNVWISAMKLFLAKHTTFDIDINQLERPRKAAHLPDILSKDEVIKFIGAFDNLKHRAIVMTYYSCGLRKSELINLKLSDIDSKRGVIRIKESKGAKDRDVMLPSMLLEVLRKYIKKFQPKIYLFNGQGRPKYSGSSVNKIIQQGLKKAGINKRITAHSLRHSYATHLVEKNINLRFIQESLGHKSSKTTEIYTRLSKEHIANMVSPIDFWEEEIKEHFVSDKGDHNEINKI